MTASNSIAVGTGASATRNGAIAIGSGARATKPGAVAIGGGSIANVADTISVGKAGNERRIVNVAAGINPTDAVNLAQVQAMLSAAPVSLTATKSQPSRVSDRRHNGAKANNRTAAASKYERSIADGVQPGLAPLVAKKGSSAPSSDPVTVVESELEGVKIKTVAGAHSTSSASFAAIPHGEISFRQGGSTAGGVMVS